MDDSAALRRRLRVEMRRLRAAAKLTQRDVAERLEWSPSKVIRIESGQVGLSVTDVRALADLYGLPEGEQRDQLVVLARGSKRKPFAEFQDIIPEDTRKFFAYEASASLIRHVQPLIVPGLLQTEDYTRALLLALGEDPKVIDRVVESRRQRQEILDAADPPKVFTLLDEAVLRRQVGGPAVMERQLRHLVRLSDRATVSVRVLPFAHGAQDALQGPFAHLEVPDANDPDVLFIDSMQASLRFFDDPEITAQYQETFLRLEDQAAPADELSRYVDRAVQEFHAV